MRVAILLFALYRLAVSGNSGISGISEQIKKFSDDLSTSINDFSKSFTKVAEDYRQNLTLWFDYPTQLNDNFKTFMKTVEPLRDPIRILLIVISILLTLLVFRCAWVAFMEVVDGFRTYCMPRSVLVRPEMPPFDVESAPFSESPLLHSSFCNPHCDAPECESVEDKYGCETTCCDQKTSTPARECCEMKEEKKKVRFSMTSSRDH